jgi:hypothetical protein
MNRKTLNVSGLKGCVTPNGMTLQQIDTGEFLIRLTARTVVSGINQYTWVKVTRASDGSYETSTQTGGPGYDPAFELNGQTATIGWVYRAKRDQNTGQPLFF